VHIICVAETEDTVAADPPKLTDVDPATKFVPVMVTVVPPAPVFGVMAVMVGDGNGGSPPLTQRT